ICFSFFEIVFDDSYDAFISQMSSQQYSDFSLMDQHYLLVILFRDFYKIIQDLLPQINVFSTAYILSNICSLYYTLYTLRVLILRKTSFLVRFVLLSILTALFLENIISITHTRFALIFSGVALINLLFRNLKWKGIVIHHILFLFGFLTRPESGIGMIIIVSAAYLILHFRPLALVKKTIIPLSAVLIFFLALQIHKEFTNRFEIKIEPDIEYALSTNRLVPISQMTNAKDSLRYEMAMYGMFIDTAFVNVNFLNRIVSNQFELNQNQIQESVINILSLQYYYLIIPVLFIIIILISIILFNNKIIAFKIILFKAFIFSLLVYLAYNAPLAERHFISIEIITLLLIAYFVFSNNSLSSIKLNKVFVATSLLIIIGSTAITLNNALGNQIQVAEEVECLKSNMVQTENVYQNEILIINLSTFHLLDLKYSFLNKNYKENDYLIWDLSNYSIVPRYLAYLSKICNCNASKPEEFLKWAEEKKAIFLSDIKRSELIERYMYLVHNTKIEFTDAAKSKQIKHPDCISNSIFGNYIMQNVKFHD
ncbi:MAG: hypothetical protein WD334_01030, partial [Chitinophagales bacterium]